ncbi:MAG: PD-(D/E)XK nuclease family protein [Lachnospiraceae bacterium]|nr:PD-(D/E)XK nuclease family protein [Lachnospiraceae bacterium]
MSLQFIIGGSGSGKTTEILKNIIDKSMEMPNKHFLVVVPEQFTMQTQKEIVRLHPFHSVMNIEILSFMRLSYRVFNETGSNTLGVLGDTGKSLIIRKIFEDHKDELSILKVGLKKAGYISEIRSFLSELSQYGISPEDLEEMGEVEGFPERFRMKIKDIVSIYRGFNDFIEGEYITTEDVLERLAEVSEDSSLIKDQVLVLDGYTGFTPVQNDLLEHILPLFKEVYVTVTMDTDEVVTGDIDEGELFSMSKKMIQSLLRICRQTGVSVLDPVLMKDSSKMRFKNAPSLSHLEQTLFRDEMNICPTEIFDRDAIRLVRAADMNEEMDFIASTIREMVRTAGYKYSDFAVVTPSVENYGYKAQNSFKRYKVPIFIDQTMKIKNHPLFEFVLRALNLVEKNFRNEDVLRFLKSRIPYFTDSNLDEFDRYITSMNIRGWKGYSKDFKKKSRRYDDALLGVVNETREKFVDLIEPFVESLKNDPSVVDISKSLYELIVKADIEKYLQNNASRLHEEGEEALARQYEDVYPLLMDLLDRMVDLLGNLHISIQEYRRILEAGFDTLKVGMIPPENDCVTFGDIERTRLSDVKVLFLCGATDGLIPKSDTRGGILSELEREKLKEDGFELAPTGRERAFRQKFYLYLILSKASERLFITSPKMDGEGKSARLSYIYSEIRKIFPQITIEDWSDEYSLSRIVDDKTAMDALIRLLFMEKNRSLNESDKRVLSLLLRYFNNGKKEELREVLANNFFKHIPEKLESEINASLVKDRLMGSVSKLETYARCPYSYYLKYLLKINEWEDSDLSSMEMGDFYHESLEQFSKEIKDKNIRWHDLSEDEINKTLNNVMDRIENLDEFSKFKDEAESRFRLNEIRKTLSNTVSVIVDQVKHSEFEPLGFEVDFVDLKKEYDFESLHYELDKGEMDLNGKIDRLDTFESGGNIYVKIVDYKSGNNTIDATKTYSGLDIQMYVYMDAALEYVHKKYGKEATPAGLYYIHVTDEVDSNNKSKSPEDALNSTVLKKGLINSDKNVLKALGDSLDSRSKNGLSDNDWKTLRDNVRDIVRDSGNRMMDGDIEAKPYRSGDMTGCSYCLYHNICHFDAKMDGYEYRNINTKSEFI